MRLSLWLPFVIAAFAFAVLHVLHRDPSPTLHPTSATTSFLSSPSPLLLPPMTSVAVVGSTGSVGQATVATLRSQPSISSLAAFTRRPFFPVSPPLSEVVVPDLFSLQPSHFQGVSAVFCCLGTTRSQAGGAEQFKRQDRDLIIHVATQAKAANVSSFQLVSSYGANADSWALYTKSKGEVEVAVKALGFPSLGIWKPSVLDTRGYPRPESRFVEKVALNVMGALGSLMGQARPIRVEHVAQAMVKDAMSGRTGTRVFDGSKTIEDFLADKETAPATPAT